MVKGWDCILVFALLVFIADVLLLTLLRLLIFSYFQEVVLARVQKLALDFVISEGKLWINLQARTQ